MSEEITEDYPDDFSYPGCLVYYCSLLFRYEKVYVKSSFFKISQPFFISAHYTIEGMRARR